MTKEHIRNKALIEAGNYETEKEKFAFVCGSLFGATEATKDLQKENIKYKEMIEDMKADMCSTKSEIICNYLSKLLKKYEFIY